MLKTIEGRQFEISEPYAEGHTVSAIEARVLNQTRSENIGNNVRAKIKAAIEEGKSDEEINALVSELDSTYVFTAAGVSSARKLDPVEREAVKLARDLLRQHLSASGRKLGTPPEGTTQEDWDDKVAGEVERIAALPDVISAAQANVEAKNAQATKLAGLLGPAPEAPAAEPQPAPAKGKKG